MAEDKQFCFKDEEIKSLRKILVGNGDAKESVLFKVNKSQLDIEDIKGNIREIKVMQDTIVEGVVHLKESFITFKSELEGREQGRRDEECKNDKTYSNRVKTIGAVIAFLGVLIAMLVGFNDMKRDADELRKYIDLNNSINQTRGGEDSVNRVDSLSIYSD